DSIQHLHIFFFSSRRRHTRFSRDWSSDVCSSDLVLKPAFKSIQQRLSLGLISVLILVGLLLAQISLWVFDQGLRRYLNTHLQQRSEERRVGKECRSRRAPYH